MRGFAELAPRVGLVEGAGFAGAAPPPPRSGFAMRPKLSGEDAAFWAGKDLEHLAIDDRHSSRTHLAPDPIVLSPVAAELRISDSAQLICDQRLAAGSRDSVYVHSSPAACARQFQLPSSMRSFGRQATHVATSETMRKDG